MTHSNHPNRPEKWRLALLQFVFCLGLASSAHSEGLPAGVVAALRAAQIPESAVAVVVQPVDAKAPLIAHNAQQAMNPASVMKLLTTYAALDLLGPAYTWKTGALVDRPPTSGILEGNLYLRGSGDPKLLIEHFWTLLRQLRVRGIRQINGDLIVDRSAFSVTAIDPGAFDDKPMRPYNVGPDALLINFRTLRFTLQPDAQQVVLLPETPSDGLHIDNKLQLTGGACGGNWKDLVVPRLLADSKGLRLEISGSYASQCGERSLNLAPLTADVQVATLFRALWKELGGSFSGQVRAGTTPNNARLVAVLESPPLAEIVRDTNKFSNNVMARQLFLALGNEGGSATPEKARAHIKQWLLERGLNMPELEIENGSGLSRRERISANSLNRLLLDAWNNPVMPELVASLPIVGSDGTMKKRLRTSEISGRAHIKTGSLDSVKSAAGYAINTQGRRFAITFLINHQRAQAGQAAIDALLLWIAQQ